jgi:hypothetical protein
MKSTQQTFWILVFTFVSSIVAQSDFAIAQVATPEAESSTVQPDASQLGSLMRVPDSAALYISTMNHKAVIDSIFESNAYQSIKSSDVARGMKKAYRRGRTRGYDDYNRRNPFAQYLQGYGESIDNVIFQSVWQIARQVIDNELFLYVDNDALDALNAIQEVQAQFMNQASLGGDIDLDNLNDEQKAALIDFIAKTAESIDCPTMILGSRLENPQGFRGMLELARSFAEQGMRNLPPELDMIRESWQVVEEDDNFLLTAQLDMSKLPWEKMLEDAEPEERKMALKIRDAVADKKAAVAVGVVDNLLVLGFAKDQSRLTQFGDQSAPGAKLIDLESLKELRSAVDENQKVVSVFYMSDEYAKASFSLEKFLEQFQPMVRPILNKIDELPDDEKERLASLIETEASQFITDFSQFMPPQAMRYAFSTLQEDGLHGYSRFDAKHPMLDGSETLKLAQHAGPDTIAFFGSSLHRLSEQYELSSKWISKLYGYGRNVALDAIEKEMKDDRSPAKMAQDAANQAANAVAEASQDNALADFNRELSDRAADDADSTKQAAADQTDRADNESADDNDAVEPDFETIKSFLTDVEALFKRFDEVNKTKLLPAIDGQEAGLFLDAISGPNPWHPDMPVAKKPLPLPFPAFVIGTKDSAAVVETGEEYWQLADDLLTSAKKHFPEEDVEEAFILPPNRIEKNGNVSFRWSFLHDFGQVDSSVQPGSLINDNWVVMNLHPEQALRLTKPQAGRKLFGPANTDQPSIGLMFYDHQVAMDSLRTWIDFAETQIPPDENPFNLAENFPAERDTLQFTEPQIRDALERVWAFAECFKGISARSYHDATGTVSESHWKFEDTAAQ